MKTTPDTCKPSTLSLRRKTARSSSRFRWNFSEASSTHRWSMIDHAFSSILSFQVGISNPLYIDRHLWQPWCSQGLRKRANVNAAEDWGKEVSPTFLLPVRLKIKKNRRELSRQIVKVEVSLNLNVLSTVHLQICQHTHVMGWTIYSWVWPISIKPLAANFNFIPSKCIFLYNNKHF